MTADLITPKSINRFSRFILFPKNLAECWLWSGFHRAGYGRFRLGRRMYDAHRVSYLFFNGEFDCSMDVCHSCDATGCSNPDHLFLGTAMDNMRDRGDKGRTAVGEANGRSKLKNFQVSEIREMRKSGMKIRDIADMFSVSDGVVCAVASRRTWRHVA